MAYTIPYTDFANKVSLVIEDGSINQETSLKLPGRNTVAYGTAIAENFLHLLENFASATAPASPVEGQLWYDSTPGIELLKVFNGANWVTASGLKRANSEPQAGQSQAGDLWVDTDNQQLYLYTGSGWVLVGPEFSDGLVTGVRPASITGTDDNTYNVLQVDVASKPTMIFSIYNFVPKLKIPGFSSLVPGINLSSANITGDGIPKYTGTAEKAENLIVNGVSVAAGNFLRSDVVSTTSFGLNVQNNAGINYGVSAEMNIGIDGNAGVIQHNITGSSIDFKLKNEGLIKNVVRIDSNLRVGINNLAPAEALDVGGNVNIAPTVADSSSGNLYVRSTTETLDLSTGSITTLGGVAVSKSLIVGGNLTVSQLVTTRNVQPDISNLRDIGSNPNTGGANYANIWATTFHGNLTGNVSGTVSGRAGSAEKLSSSTVFRISGDVESEDIIFDGQTGGTEKVFTTTISNEIISNRPETAIPNLQDEILLNRITGETGLKKIQWQNLLSYIPQLPVGMIVPYGGLEAPVNWLLCFGQEIAIIDFPVLFDTIGYNFRSEGLVTPGYFAVPDLRGRFPLGKDDMGTSGSANVIPDADVIGAKSGQREVILQLNNLPQHKHDLAGDSGDQYYVIRDISGAANDQEAITYNGPTALGAASALPTTGGILTSNPLAQAIDVVNPYTILTYIIYTGTG